MITGVDLTQLAEDAVLLAIVLCLPFFGGALLSGILIGIIQSKTKISETAMGSILRVVVVLAIIAMLAPFVAERIHEFAGDAWSLLGSAVKR